MPTRISAIVCSVLFVFLSLIVQAQQSDSVQLAHEQVLLAFNDVGQQGIADGGSGAAEDPSFEGTVVSSSRDTLVLRTSDNQFYLFTYDNPSVRTKSAVPGTKVRVAAGEPDHSGARVATDVDVVSGAKADGTGQSALKAAPVPEKVQNVENEIQRESQRWNLGVRAGAAFNRNSSCSAFSRAWGRSFIPAFSSDLTLNLLSEKSPTSSL